MCSQHSDPVPLLAFSLLTGYLVLLVPHCQLVLEEVVIIDLFLYGLIVKLVEQFDELLLVLVQLIQELL